MNRQYKSLQTEIKDEKSEALSEAQIEYATKNNIDVVSILDIKGETMDDLFSFKSKLILHLPTTSKNNGHYVAVWIYNGTFYFYDSYGMSLQQNLSLSTYLQSQGLDKKSILPNMIQRWMNNGGNVSENNFRHQTLDERVSTCGKHAIIRLMHANLNHYEYNNFLNFKNISKDDLVSLLCYLV